MLVRGKGNGEEYRRKELFFYRGVVVKNNDPAKQNRVKIFVPELANQPFDDWFEKYEFFILKAPGKNCNPKTEKEKERIGDWEDDKIFEQICSTIPWAEPCYPLMGESGNFRYYKDGEISTISDCNYPEGFQAIDKNPLTLQVGSFSPAYLYENVGSILGDGFISPTFNFTVNANPYGFSYRPSKFPNKAKGTFGIPEIGSKVWVFFNQGDLNFPIYFGVYRDYRELLLINDLDNPERISSEYPSDFEN